MTPGHVTRCKLLDLYSGTLHGSLLHRSRNNLVINHSGDYATRVSLRTFQVLRSRDIASHVTGAPEDGPSGFFTLYPGVPLDPLHKGEHPGHVPRAPPCGEVRPSGISHPYARKPLDPLHTNPSTLGCSGI